MAVRHSFSFLRSNRRQGSAVIASRIRRDISNRECKSSSRKELGPSDKARSGSGCTSIKSASQPAATAALARVGIISR